MFIPKALFVKMIHVFSYSIISVKVMDLAKAIIVYIFETKQVQ